MSQRKKPSFYLSLVFGILVVLISLYGFSLLRGRPGLPEGIRDSEVTRMDETGIKRLSDLELVLAKKNIGDWTTLRVRRGPLQESIRAQLIAFYSRVPFPTIYLITGLLSYLIGFLALGFRWDDLKARILYWLALAFSLPLIVSGGTYCLRSGGMSYVPTVLFYLFYPLAPALLVHFSLAFSKARHTLVLALIYGISIVFGCGFIVLILLSMRHSSIGIFRIYAATFTLFRVYVIALLLLAIFSFVRAYRGARLQENRAQIKWIFLGLLLGVAPFIFAYEIPKVLGVRPPLTEEFSAVFFVAAPLGLALAIFRFRFLNVDLVINRSLVYSLLTAVTASTYLLSIRLFQELPIRLFSSTDVEISLGSALLAAVIFQPARRWIQDLVDKAFFRQRYDYKKAILTFADTARNVPDQAGLVDFLAANIQGALPLERLEVVVALDSSGECRQLYPEEGNGGDYKSLLPALTPGRVCARREAVGTEEGIDFSQEDAWGTRPLELALPLPFRSTSLTGWLLADKKKSGRRFTRDDIELLLTLAMTLSLNLERIRLQEEVIYERAAKEKLDELNRLKSDFVSTVSHELRTPLTSIQGLTEILEAGRVTDREVRDKILHTLASESGRLSRLLRNILDFGRIERQTITYEHRAEDLKLIIEDVLTAYRPQIEEGGFAIGLDLPPRAVMLPVDRDAIKQLLFNLIDNAMKYSPAKKRIDLDLVERPGEVEIRVRDQGIGIAAEDRDRVFEKFFRGAAASRVNPQGVGLGLKIAKHIVEAHGGEIRVESPAGGGCLFRIVFPRRDAA